MEAKNVSGQGLVRRFAPPIRSVINCLPVEILAVIFSYIGTSLAPYESRRTTTFPFNVASTCPFWMEILKSNPANWKSISIDVVDPTPFLDELTMFTGGPIEVFVFSSVKEAVFRGSMSNNSIEDVEKDDENLQAQIILGQLEPLIKRCTSITFDLIFQSSLPTSHSILARTLPCLQKLFLKCLKHDVDDNESMVETDIDYLSLEEKAEMPLLKEISVSGYSFMQLCQLGPIWHERIGGEKRLSLSIDKFTLGKSVPEIHRETRTFAVFMGTIEDLDCSDLTLSNLSFGYRPKQGCKGFIFNGVNLTLDYVSPEFISTFFDSVVMDHLRMLHISRCLVPRIAQPILERTVHSFLILEDIPIMSIVPASRSANHFLDSSLYNAVKLFACSHLFLVNCEGVGDDFFEWLCGENDYLPAEDLKELFLWGCSGFTSGALRDFIDTRQDAGRPLVAIEVSGKGPMMSRNDLAWFLDESQTSTRVKWNVEADASMGEDFVADLRPVGKDYI